jgi:hypothetical protein
MGDVRGLYFGDSYCSRFDIIEPAIDPNSDAFISCRVSLAQQGGYYNITEWVTPGIAITTARMNYGSILNQNNYQFMVIPSVNSVSSHSGGSQGQTITIQGSGFSIDPNVINVEVGNSACNVLRSSERSITCVVQPDIAGNTYGKLNTTTAGTQMNGFISGSGLIYQRYDLTNLSSFNVAGFRNAISTNNPNITLLEQSIKPDL